MDERSLLTLLQKRPNEGMKELMRQYMGYCYYIVRNKLSEFPQEDIEECVSDVFVDAYRYREKIDLEKGRKSASARRNTGESEGGIL